MFKNLKVFLVASILVATVCSLIPSTFTVNAANDDLNNNEIEIIKSISNDKDPESKKVKIKKESKNTNNPKLVEILNEKIAVTSSSGSLVESNMENKYNSKSKNYSCWDYTGTNNFYNAVGGLLYNFSLRSNACADSSKVYSGSVRSSSPGIYQLGWSYYGEQPDRKFDYVANGQEYISSRQGLFKLCVNSNFVCIQETRPWVELHQRRIGQSDYFLRGN